MVAIHLREECAGLAARNLRGNFVGKRLRLRDAPIGVDACVHKGVAGGVAHQGLLAQPVAHLRHLRVVEDGIEGVAVFEFAVAVHQGEQVQVVVAEHDLHAAFVPHAVLQAFERLRPAVDDVAHQPKGVAAGVELDLVEQGGELGVAAL